MRLRTEHLLFLSYLCIILLLTLFLSAGVSALLRERLVDEIRRDLVRELALVGGMFESPGISPDSLTRVVRALTSRNLVIVDPAGRTVTSGTGAAPLVGDFGSRPEIRDALADPSGEGATIRPLQGTDELHLFVALRTASGHVLRLDAPLAETEAAVAAVQRRILASAGGALLLGLVFTLAFSLRVSRPLRSIGDVARALAAGDLNRRTRINRTEELGDLSVSLDRLADELQRRLGQLEGERAEMQALIDSMSEGVLAFSPTGLLRRTNPAARRMFALGGRVGGIPPEMVSRREDFLRVVNLAMEGETVPPRELAGNGRPLLATAHPLPNGGAVAVFLDISELRRLEGVRRDFVANASHELKTPLTAIRGFAETLLDPALPPDLSRRFAEIVKQNAERLQHIVDDLLDLSRIESGELRLEPASVDVAELARGVWADQPRSEKAEQIELRIDIAPGHERVVADPGALRQIFTNLFSNAIRYTPPGGSVTVRASEAQRHPAPIRSPASETAATRWTWIDVADTGAGIPATHLPRVFERFYRADPARSREEGGTGLGLAIVRHLVESHGGTIEADSAVGTGTTIRFSLPSAS